jgi:uncharacterized protein YbjQ (UPF0145 family)
VSDSAYRMQTLRYRPVEIGLDEGVPLTTLVRLFVWAFVASFLVSVVFFVLFAIVYTFSDAGPFDTGLPGSGLLLTGSVLSFVAFWLVLLGARIDEPIAEWKTLIEDRFAAADSTYAAVYGTLRGRGIPVEAFAERVRSDVLGREVVNNRLVITERSYTVFVTVFPYGTSLYTGWTMWRRRRGATILGHFLKDLAGGFAGRAGAVNQMLRTERVRAMREAVHAAVREGAEAAVQGVDVPLTAAFGQELPVYDLSAPAGGAPAPAGSPAPSGPGGPGSWGRDPATWGGGSAAPNPWASPTPGPQAAPHPAAANPAAPHPSAPQPAPAAEPGPDRPVSAAPPHPSAPQPAPAAEPRPDRSASAAPPQAGPPAGDGNEPATPEKPADS